MRVPRAGTIPVVFTGASWRYSSTATNFSRKLPA